MYVHFVPFNAANSCARESLMAVQEYLYPFHIALNAPRLHNLTCRFSEITTLFTIQLLV